MKKKQLLTFLLFVPFFLLAGCHKNKVVTVLDTHDISGDYTVNVHYRYYADGTDRSDTNAAHYNIDTTYNANLKITFDQDTIHLILGNQHFRDLLYWRTDQDTLFFKHPNSWYPMPMLLTFDANINKLKYNEAYTTSHWGDQYWEITN